METLDPIEAKKTAHICCGPDILEKRCQFVVSYGRGMGQQVEENR